MHERFGCPESQVLCTNVSFDLDTLRIWIDTHHTLSCFSCRPCGIKSCIKKIQSLIWMSTKASQARLPILESDLPTIYKHFEHLPITTYQNTERSRHKDVTCSCPRCTLPRDILLTDTNKREWARMSKVETTPETSDRVVSSGVRDCSRYLMYALLIQLEDYLATSKPVQTDKYKHVIFAKN